MKLSYIWFFFIAFISSFISYTVGYSITSGVEIRFGNTGAFIVGILTCLLVIPISQIINNAFELTSSPFSKNQD